MSSLLTVIDAVDNFPLQLSTPYPTVSPDGAERYIPFHLTLADFEAGISPVGLFREDVVKAVQAETGTGGGHGSPWRFQQSPTLSTPRSLGEADLVQCVYLAEWLLSKGMEEVRQAVQEMAQRWRADGMFPDHLRGWRDEQIQLYASSHSTFFAGGEDLLPCGKKIFTMERAMSNVCGVVVYGVHLTAYEGEGKDIQIWVPKRSMARAFPGMLDNTVCGGLTAGMTPLDCMLKECEEEASLPQSFVLPRIHAACTFSYFKIYPNGSLQPAIGYQFDLCLPSSSSADYLTPTPGDDEVDSFTLMSITDTIGAMLAGKFKPDCAAVLVDFMMRHGIVTPENDPEYHTIRKRLSRTLGLASAQM